MNMFSVRYFEWGIADSDACDRCISMIGYYCSRPGRPHDNCRCSISTRIFWLPETYQIVYKEKSVEQVDVYEQALEGVFEFVNTSDVDVPINIKFSETISGSVNVSAEVEDLFEVSAGYKASETLSVSLGEMVVPSGQGIRVNVVGVMQAIRFSAERWYITNPVFGGEPKKIFGELIEDEIEAVKGTRYVIENF